ncbi:hypothetical protein IMG5_104880 [Ichthyophthirius multifiliis]|uniref:CSC1/OSCA1-like cytosolic domain-containing protein n=1 Tax=Ichthyophthirius multifiliis TaxID=5932 RepID=G0QSZ5_ICHMU|nr:hypothetical protein IMG5_104880 [Ichthyophthirius multifiliis]EGR31666.1 hypothetical protein IMG5_104880 [Ichthyophthirius multifiliis]|eukprot:XP_004035152.1 hypothetical protein IMG5_104880 [Ichthyophthirius multifiliis]
MQQKLFKKQSFFYSIKRSKKTNCEEELKEYLTKNLIYGKNINIININRVFKIREYIELQSQKIKILNEKKTDEQKRIFKLQKINQKIKDYEQKYQNINSENIRTSFVFVTFEKQDECQEIIQKYIKYWYSIQNFNFQNQKIKLLRAPEPLDIIWENLEIGIKEKIKRRIITTLFLLSIISKYQKILLEDITDEETNITYIVNNLNLYLLSVTFSCIVLVINVIMLIIVKKFAAFEKYSTFTLQNISVATRLTWYQFINTSIVPIVTFMLFLKGKSNQTYVKYLAQNQFFIYIGNFIFSPFFTVWEIEYIYKRIKRYLYIKKGEQKCQKTQQEMNQIFEKPEFLIQEYYAIVNNIILGGIFYSSLFSIGLIIKVLTLFVLYWAFKFCFLRHSGFPKCIGNGLNYAMQEVMFTFPGIFFAGNFVFQSLFLDTDEKVTISSPLNLVQLVFSVLLVIFSQIFIKLFKSLVSKKKYSNKNNNYLDEKDILGIHYQQINPVTKKFKENLLTPLKTDQIITNENQQQVSLRIIGLENYAIEQIFFQQMRSQQQILEAIIEKEENIINKNKKKIIYEQKIKNNQIIYKQII